MAAIYKKKQYDPDFTYNILEGVGGGDNDEQKVSQTYTHTL